MQNTYFEIGVDIQGCIYDEISKIAFCSVFDVLTWRREWAFCWRIRGPFCTVACSVVARVGNKRSSG